MRGYAQRSRARCEPSYTHGCSERQGQPAVKMQTAVSIAVEGVRTRALSARVAASNYAATGWIRASVRSWGSVVQQQTRRYHERCIAGLSVHRSARWIL